MLTPLYSLLLLPLCLAFTCNIHSKHENGSRWSTQTGASCPTGACTRLSLRAIGARGQKLEDRILASCDYGKFCSGGERVIRETKMIKEEFEKVTSVRLAKNAKAIVFSGYCCYTSNCN